VKGIPLRKIILSFGLLAVVCLLWFIPMIWMTGGWNAYYSAFKELWLFNTGRVSVLEKGWASFKIFSTALFNFLLYGLGSGIFILCLAAFSVIRNGKIGFLDSNKAFFFSLWILPSFFFYLLIFIHPANPGYVLIFLPAFFVLVAASIEYASAEAKRFFKIDPSKFIALTIIILNIGLFSYFNYPISYKAIKNHDIDLLIMLNGIKTLSPGNTILFVDGDIFFCYRHVMYYLPEYTVYQPELKYALSGRLRKIFWGVNRETHLSDAVILPAEITKFGVLIIPYNNEQLICIKGMTIKKLLPFMYLVSGSVDKLREFYPQSKITLQGNIRNGLK